MNRARLIDVGLVSAAGLFAVLEIAVNDNTTFRAIDFNAGETHSVWVLGAVMVGCLALFWRRSHPVTVMLVVLGVHVLSAVLGRLTGFTPLVLAAMIVPYTATRWSTDRMRYLVVPFAVVASALATASVESARSGDGLVSEFQVELAVLVVPAILGYAVRQRADRLYATIENQTAERVHAERLRIARDLHDVVAHGLAAITLQSGVALHRAERNPEVAVDALRKINATGKTSLEELRGLVGVLRSTTESLDAPLQPAPTDPNDLTELLDRAEADGLAVSLSTSGRFPEEISDGVVIATHRIIGEALNNVARHAGSVRVDVSIVHDTRTAVIRVENSRGTGGVAQIPSTGVGITGMNERAVAVGGTLVAEPTPQGGYVVQAKLPYSRGEA